jgi:hypothetical protein
MFVDRTWFADASTDPEKGGNTMTIYLLLLMLGTSYIVAWKIAG